MAKSYPPFARYRKKGRQALRKKDIDFNRAEFEKKLDAAMADMEVEANKEIRQLAETAATFVRRNAPVGGPYDDGRTPGRLRRGIGARRAEDERGYYVDVYVMAFYAHMVEYGTEHSAPHPFFRPGILSAIAQFQRAGR